MTSTIRDIIAWCAANDGDAIEMVRDYFAEKDSYITRAEAVRIIQRQERTMKLINLTPHAVIIYSDRNTPLFAVPASGMVARIKTSVEQVGSITSEEDIVPVFTTRFDGEPIGLPDPQPDTIYIVSGIFRMYCPRPDLYQPGELVRNAAGEIIGCIGLSQ